MRGLTIALLLFALPMAGCLDFLGGDEDEDGDGLGEETGDGGDQNETMEPENATNAAPNATLSADNETGQVPFNVTFTIDVADDDGDDLNFTLDVNGDGSADSDGTLVADNGTYAPFAFTYSYTTAGLYNVTLNVTDGLNSTTATMQINATAAEGGEEDPVDTLCHSTTATAVPPVSGNEVLYVDGTWLYMESNGVPGLQYTKEPSLYGEVDPRGEGCEGGDTVII